MSSIRERVAAAVAVATLALSVAGWGPDAALAQGTPPNGDGPASVADVAEGARASVVEVVVADENGEETGGGSGVRVGPGIITNWHVVRGASAVRLTLPDGTHATAKVERTDAGYDLALLSTAAAAVLPALELELEPAAAQRRGDPVLALGYPGLGAPAITGGGPTLTRGVVSAVRTDEETGALLLQTDAPFNPGNSGGALLNLRGRLIGVPTLGGERGLGFAVAAESVRAFLDGQPSLRPVEPDLVALLLPAADLGPDYEGDAQQSGPQGGWRAFAFADSPSGPTVAQVLWDTGTPEAAAEQSGMIYGAMGEGWAEVTSAATAGKRVFVRYTERMQSMTVFATRDRYVVTVLLNFKRLPDTGGRTERAVGITDRILARVDAQLV